MKPLNPPNTKARSKAMHTKLRKVLTDTPKGIQRVVSSQEKATRVTEIIKSDFLDATFSG